MCWMFWKLRPSIWFFFHVKGWITQLWSLEGDECDVQIWRCHLRRGCSSKLMKCLYYNLIYLILQLFLKYLLRFVFKLLVVGGLSYDRLNRFDKAWKKVCLWADGKKNCSDFSTVHRNCLLQKSKRYLAISKQGSIICSFCEGNFT